MGASAGRETTGSKLPAHKQIYDSVKQKIRNLADKVKQSYYSAQLLNGSFKTSTLFSAKTFFHFFLQRLTLTTSRMSFLITSSRKSAPSEFFFSPPSPTVCPDTSFSGNPLLTFEPVTDEFVLKVINSAPAKSCELFFMKTLTSSSRPSRTSSTHFLSLALYHVI